MCCFVYIIFIFKSNLFKVALAFFLMETLRSWKVSLFFGQKVVLSIFPSPNLKSVNYQKVLLALQGMAFRNQNLGTCRVYWYWDVISLSLLSVQNWIIYMLRNMSLYCYFQFNFFVFIFKKFLYQKFLFYLFCNDINTAIFLHKIHKVISKNNTNIITYRVAQW